MTTVMIFNAAEELLGMAAFFRIPLRDAGDFPKDYMMTPPALLDFNKLKGISETLHRGISEGTVDDCVWRCIRGEL